MTFATMAPNPITRFSRSLNYDTPPGLEVAAGSQGKVVRLSGQWTALALARDRATGRRDPRCCVADRRRESIRNWDLSRSNGWITSAARRCGASGAGRCRRTSRSSDTQREIFERIALLDAEREEPEPVDHTDPVHALRPPAVLVLRAPVRRPRDVRRLRARSDRRSCAARSARRGRKSRRTSIAPAPRRCAITALVAFLIGIVLSYLSAQQLRIFGANQYIVNILGLSVIRELGPVLSAILVAGRSGSAITAQIGVMRVTEELDAMQRDGHPARPAARSCRA